MEEVVYTDSAPPKRPRRRGPKWVMPPRVTLVENVSAYDKLQQTLNVDLQPESIQQETDLMILAQLRWRLERLNMLMNAAVDHAILNSGNMKAGCSNMDRLLDAYRTCATDDGFVEMHRQYLACIKTMHAISTRTERWHPKPRNGG